MVSDEIVLRILDANAITGVDKIVIFAGVLVGLICWHFAGASREHRTKLKKQLKALYVPALVCVILVATYHSILIVTHRSAPHKEFPPGVLGILVLHIDGDNDDALQRELVSSLNDEIAMGSHGSSIEVWAFDDTVKERHGLREAHDEARKIGAKTKALFVIWGSKVSESRLSPRISIVNASIPAGNRTLTEQTISNLVKNDPTIVSFFGPGT